jgi:hypothetical protein
MLKPLAYYGLSSSLFAIIVIVAREVILFKGCGMVFQSVSKPFGDAHVSELVFRPASSGDSDEDENKSVGDVLKGIIVSKVMKSSNNSNEIYETLRTPRKEMPSYSKPSNNTIQIPITPSVQTL